MYKYFIWMISFQNETQEMIKTEFQIFKKLFLHFDLLKITKMVQSWLGIFSVGLGIPKTDEFKMAGAVIVPNTKGKSEVLML